VAGHVKDTAENLKAAIEGEHHEFSAMYPGFIAEAIAEGKKGAQTSFERANAVEEIHHGLYGEALKAVQAGADLPSADVHVCDVCGHTVIGDAPDTCPTCGAKREKFSKID
jgi:rubrerythrin